MQRVVNRVLAHHDGFDAHNRVPVQSAHQSGELAEAALRLGPADRQDFAFEYDFAVGDVGQVDGLALAQWHGGAADAASDAHFIDADRRAKARAEHFHRVRADGNGDRAGTALLVGALRVQAHVVGRDDVAAGQVFFLDHETVDARVDAVLGVVRHDDAGGDHRAAVIDGAHRHGQFEQVHIVAGEDDLLGARGGDAFGVDRVVDADLQFVLDFAKRLAAHGHDGAFLRPHDAGQDGHVVTDDIVEHKRLVGLVDERRYVADVDGLVQVYELACGAQALDEAAHIFGKGFVAGGHGDDFLVEGYSSLAPASLTTLAQRTVSCLMKSLNSTAFRGRASPPSAFTRSR